MIRADLILSYWILFWYVFYITGYISQSPKLAFYILLMINLFILFSMFFFKVKNYKIIAFVLIILIMIVIPLWTVHHTTINNADIKATLGLLVMYVGWLLWEDKLHLMRELYTDMLSTKNSTHAMAFFSRLTS